MNSEELEQINSENISGESNNNSTVPSLSDNLSFRNEYRKSLRQKSGYNNVQSKINNAKDNVKNTLNKKKEQVRNKIGLKKNIVTQPGKESSNTKKNDGLETEKSKKSNLIEKKYNITEKSKSVIDKINVKKRIKKKLILWLAPILASISLYALAIIGICLIIFVPILYISNEFNIFDFDYKDDDTEEIRKEKNDKFYSSLSYNEMIDINNLDYNDNYNEDDIDYLRGINSVYGTYYDGQYYDGEATPYIPVNDSGPYTLWRQFDSKWASNKLGDSGTLGKIGCLVTSVAIQIARTGTKLNPNEILDEFNPASFNNWLNNNNGYSGNLFIWNSTKKLAPNFNYIGQIRLSGNYQEKYNMISNYYNMGYIIVLEVGVNEHWVAVTTVSDGVINMIDPASSNNNAGDKYYNLGYANLFAYYKVMD